MWHKQNCKACLCSFVKRVAAQQTICANGFWCGKACWHGPLPSALTQLCGRVGQDLDNVICDACLGLQDQTCNGQTFVCCQFWLQIVSLAMQQYQQ